MYVTQHYIRVIWDNFDTIFKQDKEFETLHIKDRPVNMFNSLADIHLTATYAEQDLKEAEKRVGKRQEISHRGSHIRRRPKWLRNEMMRVERIENERNVQQWKYLATFNNGSLHFLLDELNKIQREFITKIEQGGGKKPQIS